MKDSGDESVIDEAVMFRVGRPVNVSSNRSILLESAHRSDY
jgi:hypothetical protein